jgi:hypothetical protein
MVDARRRESQIQSLNLVFAAPKPEKSKTQGPGLVFFVHPRGLHAASAPLADLAVAPLDHQIIFR